MALIKSILVFKTLIQINLNLCSTIQFPPKLLACLFVVLFSMSYFFLALLDVQKVTVKALPVKSQSF